MVNGKITGAGFQEDTEFHEFCDVVLGGMFKDATVNRTKTSILKHRSQNARER
jgi:hypothetical protein